MNPSTFARNRSDKSDEAAAVIPLGRPRRYRPRSMTASADPSTRYVLPADAPYLANLAALWSSNPTLARQIESLPETRSDYAVELSKSGAPTLSARTPDNRTLFLHSKYNPVAEAAKLIDSANTAPVAFYVLGLGLGYHL